MTRQSIVFLLQRLGWEHLVPHRACSECPVKGLGPMTVSRPQLNWMEINFIANGSQGVWATLVDCSEKFCFLAVARNLIFHTEETSNNLGLGWCMKKDISKAIQMRIKARVVFQSAFEWLFISEINKPILFAQVEMPLRPLKSLCRWSWRKS